MIRTVFQKLDCYVYCHHNNKLIKGWDVDEILGSHCSHDALKKIDFPGVLVQENFISNDEQQLLMENEDRNQLESSQSRRRKQSFGPRMNFKKKKILSGQFSGFPS